MAPRSILFDDHSTRTAEHALQLGQSFQELLESFDLRQCLRPAHKSFFIMLSFPTDLDSTSFRGLLTCLPRSGVIWNTRIPILFPNASRFMLHASFFILVSQTPPIPCGVGQCSHWRSFVVHLPNRHSLARSSGSLVMNLLFLQRVCAGSAIYYGIFNSCFLILEVLGLLISSRSGFSQRPLGSVRSPQSVRLSLTL